MNRVDGLSELVAVADGNRITALGQNGLIKRFITVDTRGCYYAVGRVVVGNLGSILFGFYGIYAFSGDGSDQRVFQEGDTQPPEISQYRPAGAGLKAEADLFPLLQKNNTSVRMVEP